MTKQIKSPLRYPGGKSQAVSTILEYVPAKTTRMISPFFGGGSVELALAQKGCKVIGYDGFKPIAVFWTELLKDPNNLADWVQRFYPIDKEGFKETRRLILDNPTVQMEGLLGAVNLFVMNRSSYSGTMFSGGCCENPSEAPNGRFTQSSIDRLREFAHFKGELTVDYSLWPDTLEKHPTGFMYLDPPYLVDQQLYGINGDMHRSFAHLELFQALSKRKDPWLLSYNDNPVVRAMYSQFKIERVSWRNSMSRESKQQSELLIRNY